MRTFFLTAFATVLQLTPLVISFGLRYRQVEKPGAGFHFQKISSTKNSFSVNSVDSLGVQHDENAEQYSYQIRKAKKKHLKEIAKLCVETFLGEGEDWLHINSEKKNVARDLSNRLDAANTSFLIVVATTKGDSTSNASATADSIVGFVEVASTREHCFALTADVPFKEFRVKVTSLVVDSGHRRKGIASLLLSACARQSLIWSGSTELFLEVRNENEGARLFYDKMGFKECLGAKGLVDKGNENVTLYILRNAT